MGRFQPIEQFASTELGQLELLPFRFERLSASEYLISNIVGDFINVTRDEIEKISKLDLKIGDGLYEKAFANHLVSTRGANRGQLHLLAARLRSRMAFLNTQTALHLFVVTLRCEHSCPYCQVSRRNFDVGEFDMTPETAMRALDIALSTRQRSIKIEFQGGEPLLNFPLIKLIVAEARLRAIKMNKEIEFVIATNMALMTNDILDFCHDNKLLVSTSLDGPADIHNKNRPRPGRNSHALAVTGIKKAQSRLGHDRVSGLMTTTQHNIDRPEEVIDEYIRLALPGIFLRSLSPYGFAVKSKWISDYDSKDWLSFYRRGLRYILDINKSGRYFPEYQASIILQKMLTDRPSGYVDLRSPSGVALGALVYNYDGKIFASDEGRMLAEMGDEKFCIGNVQKDNYISLMTSDKVVDIISDSLTQAAPMCSSCVFEPHCGADPVYHYATQGSFQGIKPLSEFCNRQKGIMKHLIELLNQSPEDARVLRSWVRH